MKKLLLSVAALALCFAAPAFSASAVAASADAYVKDCGVALPPVIAAEYSAGVADAAEPPADVFLYPDAQLKLPDGTDLAAALAELDEKAVPVLYVFDQSAADAVSAYVESAALDDCIVASDSPELVASMRASCTEVQGLLDFRGKEIGELVDVRNTANSSDAKIVLLGAGQISYDSVRWLQERLMTVWGAAETDEEFFAAAVAGCNGILASDVQNAYDLLAMFDEGSLLHLPMVVGHRGIYSEKQNTLAAAKLAYEAGADAVECDIYLTTDGEIVINHDALLDNTTTGTGNIEEMTLEEVLQYEVDVGGGGVNRPIATLREFFEEFKGTELVHFVEIKSSRPEIVPALKALIDECGVSDQVVVISFLEDQLARVHEQMPELSVGYLFNTASGTDALEANQSVAPINATYNPGYNFVTLEQVRGMAARGITVWPWTYPNTSDYDTAYTNGINGITTDYADRSSSYAVRLEASDFTLPNSDAEAADLTATLVTQKGERTEVVCEYIQISGTMTLLQNAEGKYYAGHGTAVVLLKYRFVSDSAAYTLYSAPVTVSVREAGSADTGGCNSSLGAASVLGGASAVSAVIIAAVLLRRRLPCRHGRAK